MQSLVERERERKDKKKTIFTSTTDCGIGNDDRLGLQALTGCNDPQADPTVEILTCGLGTTRDR